MNKKFGRAFKFKALSFIIWVQNNTDKADVDKVVTKQTSSTPSHHHCTVTSGQIVLKFTLLRIQR